MLITKTPAPKSHIFGQSSFPTAAPPLEDNEAHVWQAFLDMPVSYVQHLLSTLSQDERQRADGFYFTKDRNRFIVGRGALRAILSSYLSIESAEVQFGYGRYGKPALLDGSGATALSFNMSHSSGLGIYAVTRNRPIGIDVECLLPDFPIEDVAKRFFSARENIELSAIPSVEKVRAFFSCWTRKEAYVKARGEGLSIPLDKFDVSVDPEQSLSRLEIHGNPKGASRWSLHSLDVGSAYAAALAVAGRRLKIQHLQWTDSLISYASG